MYFQHSNKTSKKETEAGTNKWIGKMVTRDHSRNTGYQILNSKTHPSYLTMEIGPVGWFRVTSLESELEVWQVWQLCWAGIAETNQEGYGPVGKKVRNTLSPAAIATPYTISPWNGKSGKRYYL